MLQCFYWKTISLSLLSQKKANEKVYTLKYIIRLLSCVILAVTLFTHDDVYALTCVPPSHPAEELKHAEFVFKGKLISYQNGELQFEVSSVWQGMVDQQVTLNHNGWSEFVEGREYIIFALELHDWGIVPNPCGNTGVASNKLEGQLGAPTYVYDEIDYETVSEQHKDARGWLDLSLQTLGILVVLGVVLYWIWRIRNAFLRK